MNQGLDERICGYLDKQQPRHVYGLKEQKQLKLGSLLRLRVVHTNAHWDAYQEYRILREQQKLYGADAPHALAA